MENEQHNWIPTTADERAAVESQLEKMLATPTFQSSKRHSSFLRAVVEFALEHPHENLKERVLGHEVFGRLADYDTSADPIVRVTAVALRKRLNDYYKDYPGGIVITIPRGRYVPIFVRYETGLRGSSIDTGHQAFVESALEAGYAQLPSFAAAPFLADQRQGAQPSRRSRVAVVLAITTSLLFVSAAFVYFGRSRTATQLDSFWGPVLHDGRPMLIVAGFRQQIHLSSALETKSLESQQAGQKIKLMSRPNIESLVTVTNLLHGRQVIYRLRGEKDVTLADFRDGPAVLLGAFDNVWTLHFTDGLRYHFMIDPTKTHNWIADRRNADQAVGGVVSPGYQTDYAILARFFDKSIQNYVIIVAGTKTFGTGAAGEFIAKSVEFDALARELPKGWENRNIEVVISTNIENGVQGPPKLVASEVW